MSSDFKERIDYFGKMKELYHERSTIMHGKTLKGSNSHLEIENKLRKAIIAYLDRYQPNITHEQIINEIEFNYAAYVCNNASSKAHLLNEYIFHQDRVSYLLMQ